MHKRNVLTAYRLLLALVGFSSVVLEIATLVQRGTFQPVNFFSYFTIEANSSAILVFVLSGLIPEAQGGRSLAMLRGASTLYMAVTGIVFSLLLAGIEGAELTAVPWDNIVLHYIMPIAVVLDWIWDVPRFKISFNKALIWLIFPLVYVGYNLVRGHVVGWYPYPFLNPSTHGYAGVAVTSVAIALASIVLIWLLTRFTRRDRSKT